MSHECAIEGCGKGIVAGMLMCGEHWFQASPRTRAWVNLSWREASSKVSDPVRRLELIREYRTARDRAISEVRAKQEGPNA